MPPFHSDSNEPAPRDQAQVAFLASKVANPAFQQREHPGTEPSDSSIRRRSWLRRGVWWCFHAAAWLAVLCLFAVAALRVFYHDGEFVLIWLNAFTRYVYLPAYVCLAWGLWQRRWFLSSISGVVVVCHIVWMMPNFVRDRRFDLPQDDKHSATIATDSPLVRIFFANVAGKNTQHDALLEEIAAADPDVVVLVEHASHWHLKVRESPIMAPYVYANGLGRPNIGSVNMFSKVPIKNASQKLINGRLLLTVDLPSGSNTLRIIGLHGPRPIGEVQYDYPGYWRQVIPLLTAKQGPLVVVGDFNATEHSLVYAQLASTWLRSAHDDRGRGYATTWPNGENWLPPIRIDQAFLSPELECERIVEGRGLGSDHKPLIVDVRVRAQPTTHEGLD